MVVDPTFGVQISVIIFLINSQDDIRELSGGRTMHTRVLLLAGCLGLWMSSASATDSIQVGGTGGATALMARLGKLFTQQTGVGVEVIPGLGSGGGINAAADGALDIAISGRPMSVAEQARGLTTTLTIRTPYVLATSQFTAPNMTEAQIIEAFGLPKALWPDGTVIKLILRPRAESDNQVLTSLFPSMPAALDAARQRPDLPVAATDQDNAELAEKMPGSLIGTTYTQVTMEERNLRLIKINDITPSMETFENGTYRYTKVFYVVHKKSASAAAEHFIQFLRDADGVRALRAAGCLPGIE